MVDPLAGKRHRDSLSDFNPRGLARFKPHLLLSCILQVGGDREPVSGRMGPGANCELETLSIVTAEIDLIAHLRSAGRMDSSARVSPLVVDRQYASKRVV